MNSSTESAAPTPQTPNADTSSSEPLTAAEKAFYWTRLVPATLLAVLVGWLMRFNWPYLHEHFRTYPSDIWYIHENYGWFLFNCKFFNIEYPAPLLTIFKALTIAASWLPMAPVEHRYGGTIPCFNAWIAVNAVLLGALALVTVYYAHKLACRHFHTSFSRTLWCLTLTPSFIFYTIFNYDMIPVCCCVVALWYYLEHREIYACVILGLGFAFKTYPIVMFPLLWLSMPASKRWRSLAAFLAPALLMNAPYWFMDMKAWLFPYTWQMEYNSDIPGGRLIYYLSKMVGHIPAQLLLALAFINSYVFIWEHRPRDYNYNPTWLCRCTIVLLLGFILFKAVCSPQYTLWLTPFLALIPGYPFWGIYPLVELCGVTEVSFLDFWRGQCPVVLNIIRAVRDVAFIAMYIYFLRRLTDAPTSDSKEPER